MDSPLSQHHFHFGTHPDHGYVATFSANTPAHLADWFLSREQFERVPGAPGLYRLTSPEQDGQRRTRQAVQDLRKHSYGVQADFPLDPAVTPTPPQPAVRNGLMERRNRTTQAAIARSPQPGSALTTSRGTRPIPPRPAYAPTVGAAQSGGHGRSR